MYAREGSTVEEVSREIDRQHEEQRLASIQVSSKGLRVSGQSKRALTFPPDVLPADAQKRIPGAGG